MIDMISDAEQASITEAPRFSMYPGGEATNVAINISRLGGAAAVVASIGKDAFGIFIHQHLQAVGVETTYLRTSPQTPTTLAVVTRQTAHPDFAIYRGADMYLLPTDMPVARLPSTFLVHTSAFALSREPARSSIVEFIQQAHAAGCMISFDPNYHPSLWTLDADPLPVFEKICPFVAIAKPSLDDCARLFGAGKSPEAYAALFLDIGVRVVVLTMGAAGALLASDQKFSYYPMPEVEVVDVTGAGDSFWSGLLLAILDGYAISDAILVAQAVATIKLRQVGPLSHAVDRHALYAQLGIRKAAKP